MGKLLLDEYPLVILPELAVAIGLNEAIALQQVHYWIEHYRKAADADHFQDGRWWVYNSVTQWCDQFPFWSYDTIKRALASLRKPYQPKGEKDKRVVRGPLLLTANYNRAGFDKTIWYTIDYNELEGVPQRLGQNASTVGAKCTNGAGQNAPMGEGNLPQPIPETSKDHQAETTTETAAAGSQSGVWCSIHNVEMERREKDGAVWYSHRDGDGWCKGAPGDVRPEPETREERRARYVTAGVMT